MFAIIQREVDPTLLKASFNQIDNRNCHFQCVNSKCYVVNFSPVSDLRDPDEVVSAPFGRRHVAVFRTLIFRHIQFLHPKRLEDQLTQESFLELRQFPTAAANE